MLLNQQAKFGLLSCVFVGGRVVLFVWFGLFFFMVLLVGWLLFFICLFSLGLTNFIFNLLLLL